MISPRIDPDCTTSPAWKSDTQTFWAWLRNSLPNTLQPNDLDVAYLQWRRKFMIGRLRIGLWTALICIMSFLGLYLVAYAHKQDIAEDWAVFLPANIITELCLVICLIILRSTIGRTRPEYIFVVFGWSITLVFQTAIALDGSGDIAYIPWALTFLGMALFNPVCWWIHVILQLGTLGYYLGLIVTLKLTPVIEAPSAYALNGLFLFWLCLMGDLSTFLYERLQQREFRTRKALEASNRELEVRREQSEQLLLNILPVSIAEQLKQDQRTIAHRFESVSVLFADIVGFTELAARQSPEAIVDLLNTIFSQFDQLADYYGIEKIKTIGDAYMAVAGLPTPRSDHAEAIAEMALAMQQAILEFNQEQGQSLQIRIGISSGPVVAGVIGIRKFAYDLWGDTVNMASRMESHGIAGQIQVSVETFTRLRSRYQLQERGVVAIKGKGDITTYLLMGRSIDNQSEPKVEAVTSAIHQRSPLV
ncbi:MAG: adenylate/guanylate cyclase domain-containing protein [Cyanobacteria bacterium]|nr:adenylate/guanylate cyclase domain-containing protein [Cyanobacteriota bacterium]MDW8202593.1 adenylate/guanylate cyclase domain-containing protein [Cyanobacteriota bacterium SKYGB_h_bin112]